MWTNYHTHGHYCDGKEPLAHYLNHPQIQVLGFSSHAPLPFRCAWCMPSEKLGVYFDEIKTLRRNSPTEIYAGLEVDFIPKVTGPTRFTQADYTIGSIHFVDQFADGTPWEIDGLNTVFRAGLEQIFNNDYRAAWTRYFELTRQMLLESPPEILGHFDKMKIQNPAQIYFDEGEAWYQEEIRKLLDVITETGTIVEINTRGIYQKKSLTTYPSPWIIELMKARNIRITLSSDAHHPKDLCREFEYAASMLMQAGYKNITILKEGAWKEVNFNENGIILE